MTGKNSKFSEEKMIERVVNKASKILEKILEEKMSQYANEIKEVQNIVNKDSLSVKKLQQQVKSLQEASDEIIGSQSYISSHYDEINQKLQQIEQSMKMHQGNTNNISKELQKLSEIQTKEIFKLDELEQYGRRDNLELHGVPMHANENTNFIVKKLAGKLNVKIEDQAISTSHRLPLLKTKSSTEGNKSYGNHANEARNDLSDKPPPIIVRFANRDVRNQLYQKRNQISQIVNFEIPGMQNLYITENLTKSRKVLFLEAKKKKVSYNYKYLWTNQGQILMRRNQYSRVFKISSPEDLNQIN